MKKKRNAFTLIEMVIVLAIVALLILLISPNLVAQKQRAEKKTDQALVTTLQTQVELAADEQGHQIKSLDGLTDNTVRNRLSSCFYINLKRVGMQLVNMWQLNRVPSV